MKKLSIVGVSLMLVLVGCDADVFDSNCRQIASSGYSLCRDDNGTTVFYLEPNRHAPSGGGVLEGTVDSIGWDDKVIVAARRATFRGDPDGLMVVDLAGKKVEGPFDQSRIAAKYPQIKLVEAANAWSGLR